jgi:hypothetical protein
MHPTLFRQPIDKCVFAEHSIAETGTMKARGIVELFGAGSFESIASRTLALFTAHGVDGFDAAGCT